MDPEPVDASMRVGLKGQTGVKQSEIFFGPHSMKMTQIAGADQRRRDDGEKQAAPPLPPCQDRCKSF